MFKLSKPLLIFFIMIAVGLVITAAQRLFVQVDDQVKIITSNYPSSTPIENTKTSLDESSTSSMPVSNKSEIDETKIPKGV